VNREVFTNLAGRIDAMPYSGEHPVGGIIPFSDFPMYLALAGEAALSVGRHGGEDLIMVVDSDSAVLLHSLNEIRQRAKQVIVFGEVPQTWAKAPNVYTRAMNAMFRENDHALILISSKITIAIIGTEFRQESEGEEVPAFKGGWCMQHPYVAHAAEAILGDEAREFLDVMPYPPAGSPQLHEIAMRLMNLHATALENRQHDIEDDKKELHTVLDILKAISAKRRAHDILFVFVEQIARVVTSERCSVVRIWGGEKGGQVLASHEDANVADYSIDLEKYPELMKAIETGEKVVINNTRTDPLTREFSDVLQEAGIYALLVIPIVLYDQNIGSLFLRAARKKGSFSLREISFFEIVTSAAANALERAHLFESIQLANKSLERLATTDALTNVYNRRYFMERLTEELERSLRYHLPLTCMIFDVDDFKKLNDTYGHLAGDSALHEMARRTMDCVRKCDIVARYGGEEFVVIMPQTDIRGALKQAERLRQTIAAKGFDQIPRESPVTVSIGVAELDHESMVANEDLLRLADANLYAAKRQGKNRVVAGLTGADNEVKNQ
jgi:diguanylate cyclase (GGDEF)-like protein